MTTDGFKLASQPRKARGIYSDSLYFLHNPFSDLLTNSTKQAYFKHLLLLAAYYVQGTVLSWLQIQRCAIKSYSLQRACSLVEESDVYIHTQYLLFPAVTSFKRQTACHEAGRNHSGASN